MKVKFRIVVAACMALLVSACGSRTQNLIVGRWEVEGPAKLIAEFTPDGTARLTIFGRTLQGTYKLNGEDELVWTVNGMTTRMKVKVTATELAVTDDANRTVKYRRK